jgi:hypothetical protein
MGKTTLTHVRNALLNGAAWFIDPQNDDCRRAAPDADKGLVLNQNFALMLA